MKFREYCFSRVNIYEVFGTTALHVLLLCSMIWLLNGLNSNNFALKNVKLE